MSLPRASAVARATAGSRQISLNYEERLLRRKRLTDDAGTPFMVDLPETVSLDHGDALMLEDGTAVEVIAASESLLRVSGPNLPRLAWHIGNRHTPCQIADDHLLIARDHVLEAMLHHLGADVETIEAPFRPEGGAYGHGRTFGHDHGPAPTPDATHGANVDRHHGYGFGPNADHDHGT